MNWDDFGAEKLSYSTIDGVHYGMPVDNGTAIFAYRTDILEQCGYTLADVTGITWDRFIEIGEDVWAKTGKYLLSMDGSGNDLPYMMLQAEGLSQFKDGAPYIAENEAMVQIITKLVEMVQKNILFLSNDWTGYTDGSIIGDQVRQLTPEEKFRVAQAVRYLLRCGCKGDSEMAKMDMAKALNYTYRALTDSWLPKEFMDKLPVRK